MGNRGGYAQAAAWLGGAVFGAGVFAESSLRHAACPTHAWRRTCPCFPPSQGVVTLRMGRQPSPPLSQLAAVRPCQRRPLW